MATEVLTRDLTVFVFRRFSLTVADGPDRGKMSISEGPELVVGTAAGNQLVLTDPAVSRHHLVITASPQKFRMRDLGSTNGTFLGNHRVEIAYLNPGSTMRIGMTTLRFDVHDEEISEPVAADERFGRILGRSVAMRRIFSLLPRIAASNATLLIEGETGTGKGLLAEDVHRAGPRAEGPFIVVDCASIPSTLMESELFGHTKGAFTGADSAAQGAFEAAEGGTVFLDEVGELPLALQPKLLRVLEDRVVKRIGTVSTVPLDVRVIAATNRDLRVAVNRGAFRADLYYRLETLRLRMPSLRERPDDILLLGDHFYRRLTEGASAAPRELLEELAAHDWPGNVRQLRSAVERAVLLGDAAAGVEPASEDAGGTESAAGPRYVLNPALSFRAAKERALAGWERWFVTTLLRQHGGNLSRAARAASMDRTHLRDLYRKHGGSPADE